MALLSNIVLADAQATPVNHTFVPSGPDQQRVQWLVDRSAVNAIGYWKISIETIQPPTAAPGQSSSTRTYRVKVGLHEPVLETAGDSSASGILPAPTVAYIPRGFLEWVLPERGTLQNRKDIYKMLANLADNSQIQDAVENLIVFSS